MCVCVWTKKFSCIVSCVSLLFWENDFILYDCHVMAMGKDNNEHQGFFCPCGEEYSKTVLESGVGVDGNTSLWTAEGMAGRRV